MKQFLFSCFLFVSVTCINAQTNNKIVIGVVDSIYSPILHEQRKIWVYVPNSDTNDDHSNKRYPVVYLLDGETHFHFLASMIEQLGSVNGSNVCPQMIVVGIPNTDRTRDLTPTHMDAYLPFMDSDFCRTSGGGEQFISFIEKELMPHIDALYPTAPYRTLIGHSFGGLTVMNTLIHHTNLFNAYVAIDPSMWWDDRKLLKETRSALQANTYPGTRLFLGIANTMDKGMDTMRVKKDTTITTEHIRSILMLRDYLNGNKQNKLTFSYRYYSGDDHTSAPLISEYDALHFIFDYYKLNQFLYSNNYLDARVRLDSLVDVHYKKNVSKQLGYNVTPPEDMVSDLAYLVITLKQFDKAEQLLKMNVTNYPGSFSAYDLLGDLYVLKGDKLHAIDNYKKALAIKALPETRQKLEKLLLK